MFTELKRKDNSLNSNVKLNLKGLTENKVRASLNREKRKPYRLRLKRKMWAKNRGACFNLNGTARRLDSRWRLICEEEEDWVTVVVSYLLIY